MSILAIAAWGGHRAQVPGDHTDGPAEPLPFRHIVQGFVEQTADLSVCELTELSIFYAFTSSGPVS